MIWSDFGIVISSRRYGEKYKIVDVFTKTHGRSSGLIQNSNKNNLSIFSNVYVTWSSKSNGSLGFWKIQNEKQNWTYVLNKKESLLIFQSICFILDKVLPYGVVNEAIFNFINFLASEIYRFTKLEALNLYAYFEFILLNSVGYGFDIEKCAICGKKEDVHFLSPKTGHGASNNCVASVYSNKLFEIPKSWNDWNKNDFSYIDKDNIKNSLYITGYFIEQNIIQTDNYFRDSIIELLAA